MIPEIGKKYYVLDTNDNVHEAVCVTPSIPHRAGAMMKIGWSVHAAAYADILSEVPIKLSFTQWLRAKFK